MDLPRQLLDLLQRLFHMMDEYVYRQDREISWDLGVFVLILLGCQEFAETVPLVREVDTATMVSFTIHE